MHQLIIFLVIIMFALTPLLSKTWIMEGEKKCLRYCFASIMPFKRLSIYLGHIDAAAAANRMASERSLYF